MILIILLIEFVIFQIARAGHSATLFGSKIIMFGGENSSRNLLNDLHVLDLETLTWDVVEAK